MHGEKELLRERERCERVSEEAVLGLVLHQRLEVHGVRATEGHGDFPRHLHIGRYYERHGDVRAVLAAALKRTR